MKKRVLYIFCALIILTLSGCTDSKIPMTETDVNTATSSTSSKATTLPATTVATTKKASSTAKTSVPSTTEKATKPISTKPQTSTTEKSETTGTTQPELPFTLPDFNLNGLIPTTTQAETSTTKVNLDASVYDNCAFVGNSRFVSLKNYGLAKNVYPVVGLNVDTVFTKSVAGSNVALIDELNGKDYDKIILMFGDNECGWPNQNVFIEKYAKVINAVRERVPEAEIYLHAILPVSAEASATNQFGCNNPNINSMNKKIKQLATDEGIHFIEQPSCLKDSEGALLPEAASDGIHLNKKYSKIWIDSLATEIF